MIFNRLLKHVLEIPAFNENNLPVLHNKNNRPRLIRVLQLGGGFRKLKSPQDFSIVSGTITTSGVNFNFNLPRPSRVKVEFWFEDSILKDNGEEFVIRPNAQKNGVVLQGINPGGIGEPPPPPPQ